MANLRKRFAKIAERPFRINGCIGGVANPAGLSQLRDSNALIWQPCLAPLVDSVELFGQLANRTHPSAMHAVRAMGGAVTIPGTAKGACDE